MKPSFNERATQLRLTPEERKRLEASGAILTGQSERPQQKAHCTLTLAQLDWAIECRAMGLTWEALAAMFDVSVSYLARQMGRRRREQRSIS